MLLYHGTSVKALKSIKKEGVLAPSFWTNDLNGAINYAKSFKKGIVLVCDIENYDFKVNMQVAQCLLDDGEIDELPNENDLTHSLEYCEGIVCYDNISIFDTFKI